MSEKKGATRQSFIRKEITTYRIGTLKSWVLYSVLSYNAELASWHKILEKWCIKISSKLTAGFLVAPRSLADSVHTQRFFIGTENSKTHGCSC